MRGRPIIPEVREQADWMRVKLMSEERLERIKQLTVHGVSIDRQQDKTEERGTMGCRNREKPETLLPRCDHTITMEKGRIYRESIKPVAGQQPSPRFSPSSLRGLDCTTNSVSGPSLIPAFLRKEQSQLDCRPNCPSPPDRPIIRPTSEIRFHRDRRLCGN